MSSLPAARAALARRAASWRMRVSTAAVSIFAGLFLSCGTNQHVQPTGPSHSGYITLPGKDSVYQLRIDNTTGMLSIASQTPQLPNSSPDGLVLAPSRKFLYVVNAGSDSISTFAVNGDGSLSLTATPIAEGGISPLTAALDPSGQYLLVTNSLGDPTTGTNGSISVFSIDSSSGALTAFGSPIPCNSNPTNIIFTHSGNFVYVSNTADGVVTGFTFSAGVLTPAKGTPVISGTGASALAIDTTDSFLYVANTTAVNFGLPSVGNIAGFTIDATSGALTPMAGSPFTSPFGNGPSALTVDPTGRFLYATTNGSSYSIWCFVITSGTGILQAAPSSPFSVAAGAAFAVIDPIGNFFYIGSESGGNIQGYTYNTATGAPTAITNSPFAIGGAAAMVLSE